MRVYTLYDKKLGEYGSLVVSANDETVTRSLRDEMPAEALPVKYPSDFTLVCLGDYDKLTGRLVAEAMPRMVLELTSMYSGPSKEERDAVR